MADRAGLAEIPRLTAAEVWRALTSNEELLLVCAYGEDAKFRNVALVGAVARSRFDEWVPQLPKDQRVVFYCAWPGDTSAAGTAARYRDEQGFANAAVLENGVAGWRDAGFPMASSVG